MQNIEKLNQIFIEVFNVEETLLNDNFCKDTVDTWDSVHQLNIISLLEETFDIMLDPEDIMACSSFLQAKEILRKNDIEI